MMKKIKTHSLRFRTVLLLLLLMVVMSVLIAYNNYSAYSLLLKKIYGNTEDTLALYQEHLDETLKRSETYLYMTATNDSGLISLKSHKKDTQAWFSALYQLQNNLNNAMATYTVDDIFCYLPEQNAYISGSGNSTFGAVTFRNRIKDAIQNDCLDLGHWSVVEQSGSYYFIRVLHIGGAYVGAWVSMDALLEDLAQNDQTNSRLYFVTEEGELLQNGQESITLTPPRHSDEPYNFENISGTRMLTVSRALDKVPIYLTILVPDGDFTNSNKDLASVITIVVLGLILLWLFLAVALRRWILKPVHMLTDAIVRLRSGDLEIFVPSARQLDEFQNMTNAFNEMVTEIKDLKIDVYERKLQKQKLEAQYLKQQITPHFMINCLNTTYQLTETGHFDLARKMLKDLSCHIRFILSSGQTVSLGEELTLVENYIELSEIRYPYSIRYCCQCSEELRQSTAIPLLILNFVENTIKHEVRMGSILEIHVEVSEIIKDGQPFVSICIWDTGGGFSANVLELLQNIDLFIEKEAAHIGISNVILRARHVFLNPAFSFENRPGAGAQINITLPLRPFGGQEKRLNGTE